MSPDAVLDQIAQASPLAFVLVAAAGLMIGIAPSSLPLMSVGVGCTAGPGGRLDGPKTVRPQWRTAMMISVGFVLGMATVDAAIGGLFGLVGHTLIAIVAVYRALINILIAAVLVVLGLALLRAIRISLPVLRPEWRPAASFGGAYVLGIPFALSTCPMCTPMVLPIMAAAAATGTPWLGAALLFTFGLARGVPLILVGTFTDITRTFRDAGLWIPRIERVGGGLLLLAAAWFLYQGGVYAGLAPPVAWLAPG